jgi:hypothetical protein
MKLGGREIDFQQQTLHGADINFTVVSGNLRETFKGRVAGDRMEGTVDLGGGKKAQWTATRVAKTALQ